MLLALDMGNTNITIGVFDGGSLLLRSRMATDRRKLVDQYAVELSDILRLYRVDPHAVDGAILSSVVPPLDHALCGAVDKVTGICPLQIGPGLRTGIDIRIDDPAQLGADLIVGAAAAVARVGAPCIVWDLGTATTVSVVDRSGAYRGGAIMPGVMTGLDSLTANTSLLPSIRIDAPTQVVGTNTISCLQSGAVFGNAAMMDGMNARIFAELGYDAPVIVTGGLGRQIAAQCQTPCTYIDELLLEGLRLIFEKNRPAS